MLGILPPSLLLTLWGEHVGAFSIKHLLSSKGPLFPFQWSLRFHDTVYLTDSQLKFSSGIHEIHIKGRKKIKQKKSFHLSFVEVRKQLTLRLISWHGSHKTMGRAPTPAPHYRHPLPACMGRRICRRLWAVGWFLQQQRVYMCVCVWWGECLTVQVLSVSMGSTRPYKSPHTISKIYLQDGKMKLSSCNLKSIQEVALLTVL